MAAFLSAEANACCDTAVARVALREGFRLKGSRI
jgi:hypothetical protein